MKTDDTPGAPSPAQRRDDGSWATPAPVQVDKLIADGSVGAAPQKDTRTQAQKDRYDFGDIDDVQDLDPAHTQKGMTSREASYKKRLESPDNVGYFEVNAASVEGASHLQVDPQLATYSNTHGGNVVAFQSRFNSYAVPLRSTLRAMGRVKDLSVAGAALTPADLKKTSIGRKFGSFKPGGNGQIELDSWSNAQTSLNTKIDGFAAGQLQLQSAVEGFGAAQKIVEARRKEAQRANKQGELHKITRTAETLAKITEVSIEAWNAYGAISQALEASGGLDPSSKDEAAHIEQDDHAGEAQSKTRKRGGKVLDAAGEAAEAVKTGSNIYRNVNKYIAQGQLNITLRDVFIILDGGAQRYAELQRDIALLNDQIADLRMESELKSIDQATTALKAWKADLNVRRDEVRNARAAARKGARTFAARMGTGADGVMAMYAAEASFELEHFAEVAAQQRRAVEPSARQVAKWIQEHRAYFRSEPWMIGDVQNVLSHAKGVIDAGTFFERQLPTWQKTAAEWNAYFKSETSQHLVTEENDADRRSNAP